MSALSAAVLVQQQAGHRNDPSLRLPRSQPARHAVRPARRARDGRAQPAAHHRRSAAGRRLSRRHRRVRRRFDRPHQRGHAAEPRLRHRRPGASACRRRSTSASRSNPARSTSTKSCAGSRTRSRPAPSSSSRSRCSTSVSWPRFLAPHRGASSIPILAGDRCRSRALRHAEFMANEVPGVRVPEAVLDRMRRAERGRAAAKGLAIAREIAARSGRWSRGSRFRQRGRGDATPWPSWTPSGRDWRDVAGGRAACPSSIYAL